MDCWYVLARDDEEAKVGNYIGGAQGDAGARRIWKERACRTFFLCVHYFSKRDEMQRRKIDNREESRIEKYEGVC